ncbi:MAG: glucose-6-phosphate isomerase, partial [Pseudohongiellaceae bacterium]
MTTLTDSPAWQSLRQRAAHFQQPGFRLDSLFAQAGDRFDHFSIEADGLLLDYSKNYLDEETLLLLLELAQERDLNGAIGAMFAGAEINNTEQRPALHVALREPVAKCRF